MNRKPTYKDLEQRIRILEEKSIKHKRAEDALRKWENIYRNVIENAQEAILIAQGVKLVFANHAALNLTGYSEEKFMSEPFTHFIHPDDRNIVANYHLRKLMGEEVPPVYSFRVVRQDGTVMWAELNAKIISWNGKPASLNFVIDITKRKQMEEALRESEEKYRQLFENAGEGILITRGEIIEFANPAFAKILGYPIESIRIKPFISFIHPDDREMVLDYHIRKMRGEPVDTGYDFRINTGIRQERWLHITSQVISWNGKPASLSFVMDITDVKESVERLRKSLGATVQAIASMVETRDPYTAGHQRHVADLARAIAREMGLSNDQINGLRMGSTIHDIGKISIPSEILTVPRKLNDIEFGLIKTHAQFGYDILKDIEFPWPIARMVLDHHERMDGSGYPNGLTGDYLLLEVRILAVADVVEAMATHRPYRPALGIDAALEEITKNKGILYDPAVVTACLLLFNEKGFKIRD